MTDTQILTVVIAMVVPFLAVFAGVLLNNSRLNDVRDTLRAEMRANQSELLAKFAELDGRLSRIEGERRIVR
jgi:hypothetical protein